MRRWKINGYYTVKERGSIGNIMVTGVFVLAMLVVMSAFLENLKLIQQKLDVDQLARRYILHMETVGGLLPEEKDRLERELENVGVTEIDLSGTTMESVGYGGRIELCIHGMVGAKYEIEERRVSTAKH